MDENKENRNKKILILYCCVFAIMMLFLVGTFMPPEIMNTDPKMYNELNNNMSYYEEYEEKYLEDRYGLDFEKCRDSEISWDSGSMLFKIPSGVKVHFKLKDCVENREELESLEIDPNRVNNECSEFGCVLSFTNKDDLMNEKNFIIDDYFISNFYMDDLSETVKEEVEPLIKVGDGIEYELQVTAYPKKSSNKDKDYLRLGASLKTLKKNLELLHISIHVMNDNPNIKKDYDKSADNITSWVRNKLKTKEIVSSSTNFYIENVVSDESAFKLFEDQGYRINRNKYGKYKYTCWELMASGATN